jgi:hypothetical protein
MGDVGLSGSVAVVKMAKREAGCGENCDEGITEKEAEKQRTPTREKGGSKPKTRKKEPQRRTSTCDGTWIRHRNESEVSAVREDHTKAMVDIETGRSRSQNRCKEKKIDYRA